MRKKVLIIAHHRLDRSPGQRFRFEQYLSYLEQNGFEFTISNIVDEQDDGVLYAKGKLIRKFFLALKAWWIRYKDVRRANDFDIIFIFREAFFTGSDRFEKAFSKSKAKVIFDFDDAIWLPNVSLHNRKLKRLKNPGKTEKLIAYADMVFAGNNYLASYARQFNQQVKVIPTTIDLNYHTAKGKVEVEGGKVVIGWTGSQTTLQYLDLLSPVLKRLQAEFADKIEIKVICDHAWEVDALEVENVKWEKEQEIYQLHTFDIGIMPLTDDDWSRGKCAFKALQYMAIGIPAVISAVGVNKEIIQEGQNGFTADTEEEWYQSLKSLILDAQLRERIGLEAREYVRSNYSVETYKKRYLNYFEEVLTL
ncbi:MAG: glycosyl transferase family 1 [Flavobacteriales bacterium]|nr:glycosyl transferase family 1 [Flavobacteriales bacterium]|tara:strand:+ start:605 stop:1696 length:1092 start_codon:yes stop_codon:yes gene_type:complete